MSISRPIGTLALMAAALLGASYAVGVRINDSPSIPVGLYLLQRQPAKKGDFVMVCPPANAEFLMAKERGYITAGFCPGRLGALMKHVVATTGDSVAITDSGVVINGLLMQGSAPKATDLGARPLPQLRTGAQILAPNAVFLMGFGRGLPISFDSRYVGQFDTHSIVGTLRPLITW